MGREQNGMEGKERRGMGSEEKEMEEKRGKSGRKGK